MHTKDKLARALADLSLDVMASKAAEGYYHDFLSPLDTPEIQLCHDLAEAAAAEEGDRQKAILALRKRVINGDFDASKKESDDWAASPEGRAAFNSLLKGRKP